MKHSELVKKYLQEGQVMQLATVTGGQPWICTVYYVTDDQLNFYWLSFPSRRHSREIEQNNKVAVTIPVKFDQPVIGLQAEGTAEIVSDPLQIEKVMAKYTEKYNTGKDFYANFKAGKNKHQMYRFIASHIVLFDEVNFPGDSRQVIAMV